MNYGIWINSNNHIQAGFETSTGTDNFITISSKTYNDGIWHYAVATYDGLSLKLYIDGVQIASLSTTAIPDHAGTQPVRIGANSISTPPPNGFFTGNVDEVRVWNRALSSSEVSNAYNNGIFNTNGQVLYLPFS